MCVHCSIKTGLVSQRACKFSQLFQNSLSFKLKWKIYYLYGMLYGASPLTVMGCISQVGAFVKVLRMCFRYGLSVSEGKASCSRIWEADLKDLMSTWCSDFDELEESAVHADTCGENIMFVSDKSEFISSKFSFDTFNENDAIDLPNDKGAFLCKSTELRLYSLSTIQVGRTFKYYIF